MNRIGNAIKLESIINRCGLSSSGRWLAVILNAPATRICEGNEGVLITVIEIANMVILINFQSIPMIKIVCLQLNINHISHEYTQVGKYLVFFDKFIR